MPQRVQPSKSPHESFLCEVFGEGPISNQSQYEAEYRPAETLECQPEGVRISGAEPLGECFCPTSAVFVGHVQGLNASTASLIAFKSSIGFNSD